MKSSVVPFQVYPREEAEGITTPDLMTRDDVDVVDGGATMMPGLIESLAHLSIDNTDDLALRAELVDAHGLLRQGLENCAEFMCLEAGFEMHIVKPAQP
jgi:hypothetical protein